MASEACPRGDVVFQQLPGGSFTVLEAPPRAWIAEELLEDIRQGREPHFSFTPGPHLAWEQIGGVLRIDGGDKRFVYRISFYDAQHRAYRMEWPD